MTIGEIGNYYGQLEIRKDNDKYYWGIENWNGIYWEEIPKSLFSALVKFERNRKSIINK